METPAEKRRRLAALGVHFSVAVAETAAEKRRKWAALGIRSESSEEDDDDSYCRDGPSDPTPDMKRVRFDESTFGHGVSLLRPSSFPR